MKLSNLTALSVLVCILCAVDGTSLREKKVKGDAYDPHRQLLQQRKSIPINHILKATMKLARTSSYSFPAPPSVPTLPPQGAKTTSGGSPLGKQGTGEIASSPQPMPTVTDRPTRIPTKNPTSSPTNSPTSTPTKSPTSTPSKSPTPKPTYIPPSSSLTIIGNNGSPEHLFPLGMCQGDCDDDSDCQPGLKCMERGAFEKVPGCNGNGAAGRDYCIDPSLTDAPTDSPTRAPVTPKPTSIGLGDPLYRIMIRLYWSIDYFWQETKTETWWCLECTKCDEYSLGDGPNHGCVTPGTSGSSCAPGHLIWIRKCKDSRRKYEWNIVNNPGSGDQVRAAGTNLCLHTVNKQYLEMQPCDNSRSEQLWMPITDLDKFELRPYSQRNWSRDDAVCLTQMHHPKEKELVGLQPCRRALGHETLFWEEFQR